MDWEGRWRFFVLGFALSWWLKPTLQRLWMKFNDWLDEKANIT